MARLLTDQRVVVIGAGVGGLVAALQLAARGLQVDVVERAATPGGKMRQVWVGGAPIDSGPTVFTLRWVLEQVFASAGTTLDAHLDLVPLDVLARHAWEDGARLDLYGDARRSADAIADFSGPDEAKRFLRFCDKARRLYATLERPYMRSERPTLPGMISALGPRGLALLSSLGPFANLWQAVSRYFRDPRLRQLFGRYATYCGSSPWAAPATLMLVAQVEMDGVWSVTGGMHAVARALADVAARHGARFHYERECAEILVRHGRACGVRLADGERIEADHVVFNGDSSALPLGLLGPAVTRAVAAVPRSARSLSALTWSIHARTSGFPLVRHNIFFGEDYASEMRDVFIENRLPRQPTVYVCAQDRDDGAAHPDGPERLLCIVNAPAVGDTGGLTASEIEACERTSFALVERCGLRIDRRTDNTVVTAPQDFHRLFPGSGGAIYGRATHGWMALFKRPSSISHLPGLYLAGGTVHPGPGVPMAALSGQLAAATLMAHLDSTSRSRPVVISGGTSMRSATTGGTG